MPARHPADAARINARAQQQGFPQGEGYGKTVTLPMGAVKEVMRLLPAALNIYHALYATSCLMVLETHILGEVKVAAPRYFHR